MNVIPPDYPPGLFASTEPDDIGKILGTGFVRFVAGNGVEGLCVRRDTTLEILALLTPKEKRRQGRCREFLRGCCREFETVCVWYVDNPVLRRALRRYGFRPETTVDCFGDPVHGYRWDRKEHTP